MEFAEVALDAWAAVVVLAIIGVGLIFLLGATSSLLTVVAAKRRARLLSEQLGPLAQGSAVDDLAAIDDALTRILAEEQGALVG